MYLKSYQTGLGPRNHQFKKWKTSAKTGEENPQEPLRFTSFVTVLPEGVVKTQVFRSDLLLPTLPEWFLTVLDIRLESTYFVLDSGESRF